MILAWVNRADLYRIKGVGAQYSDLLEKAGVDTVVELSKRVASNLYQKMVEVNLAKNLVNGMPGLKRSGILDRTGQKNAPGGHLLGPIYQIYQITQIYQIASIYQIA